MENLSKENEARWLPLRPFMDKGRFKRGRYTTYNISGDWEIRV